MKAGRRQLDPRPIMISATNRARVKHLQYNIVPSSSDISMIPGSSSFIFIISKSKLSQMITIK